jgi:MFS family permease
MDRLRVPRRATTVVFLMTGAVGAAWSTRIPAVRDRLDLSAGELSAAIVALEFGAIVGLPLGGVLVARRGSRWALRVGFAVYPTALLGVAAAPGLAVLGGALAVLAVANSVVDVAMNAQGAEIERRAGRSALAGMHAGHSVGLIAGGLAGTLAAAAGVPVGAHFAATAVLGVLVGLVATRSMVPEAAPPKGPVLTWPGRPLRLLAVLAFGAFMLDGAAANWSAVQLSDRGAPPALAASAFLVFATGLALGRLVADRLVTRFGRGWVLRSAGLLAAGGVVVAIGSPIGLGLAGWAIFGLGVAAFAPVVLGAASQVADVQPPVAIAMVTTVGYLGSFTGPVIIGGLAGVSTVSTALGVLVAVSIGLAFLARPAFGGRVRAVPEAAVRERH